MKTDPNKPSYRILEKGEMIEPGDEWLDQNTHEWVISILAGTKVKEANVYRRQITE